MKITKFETYVLCKAIILAIILNSCQKDKSEIGLPLIETHPITNIVANSATCGGHIFNDGGSVITSRGICWSTNPEPTIKDNKTTDSLGIGEYISLLTNLEPDQTYYVRAYATNAFGTAYGETRDFITLNENYGLPIIETHPITDIKSNVAVCGGFIFSNGGFDIIVSGICWTINSEPTINDNKTTDGSTSGDFLSLLTNLEPEQTYHFRAYATNSFGTGYGEIKEFKTVKETLKDIDGNEYQIIKIGNQTWMAENLRVKHYRNGDPIEFVEDDTQWGSLDNGAYCFYNNEYIFEYFFGKFYNYYAITDSRNIAPEGWHVPTDEEWSILINYLGGNSIAGGKMKAEGTDFWDAPNLNATNESGFNALPASYRNVNGTYSPGGYMKNTYFWSTTERDIDNAWYFILAYDTGGIVRNALGKRNGFSVRCIKD
ncbi:MAG: fibrobacter succinogenes major paralogous domain-containing protein [Bacteroidales bacterium]